MGALVPFCIESSPEVCIGVSGHQDPGKSSRLSLRPQSRSVTWVTSVAVTPPSEFSWSRCFKASRLQGLTRKRGKALTKQLILGRC